MPRFSPGVVILLFAAAIVFATCDAPLSTDLLSPDGSGHKIEDGRNIDSNVYLLPPIGESYTAINFDEYTPTRVEVCSLDDPNTGVPLEDYTDLGLWDGLETAECLVDDPWFERYEETSSTDGVTFIELIRDADEKPVHYQVNLKTEEGMAEQTFRVKVFTLSVTLEGGVDWVEKARFDMALYDNASISVPDDWVGVTAGKAFPAKYVVERQQEDSYLVRVSCDSATYTGATAGAHLFENTFYDCTQGPTPQDTTFYLLQEPITVDVAAGEQCIPVGWEQDPTLCYHWQYYFQVNDEALQPYDGELADSMMVIYCPPELTEQELWQGLKSANPYDPDAAVYETTNTSSAPFFSPACGETSASADAQNGFYAALLGVRNGLARFLGLNPRLLYAAHRGFGELVGGTSRFGRAKAKELIYTSGDGQSGLIGSQLSQPLKVQVFFPHDDPHEGDEPRDWSGETVTFEITSSTGGYLSLEPGGNLTDSLDAITDTAGYAQVWWTLGTEAGDQTVDAYGDGFGTLVDDHFVSSLVTFTANAIDVVTDFREPLDEKSDFSGEAYMQALPHVLLCEVPANGPVAQPCADPLPEFDETAIKLTEDNGRWFYQVNWKPKEFGVESGRMFVAQVVLDGGVVVGESVGIVVEKGGKVELVNGQLQINPTTDLPIKFTLSRVTP